MSGTEEWLGVVEAAESLNWYVAVWHDLGYADPPAPECKTIPPLGERSAEAVKGAHGAHGAHGAIEVIDIMVRELQAVRGTLTDELKADEAAREKRQ